MIKDLSSDINYDKIPSFCGKEDRLYDYPRVMRGKYLEKKVALQHAFTTNNLILQHDLKVNMIGMLTSSSTSKQYHASNLNMVFQSFIVA